MREGDGKRIAHIKISNLTYGVHRYKYECVAADFTDGMIDSERFSSSILVEATLTKTASEIVADVLVATTLSLQCDRCLAPIRKAISGAYRILFLQSADATADEEPDDDVRFLSKNDTHIDLTTDIRETLLLAVPMKNVCQAGCAENDAPIEREFPQRRGEGVESAWQRQLAELSKKFKN